MPNEQLTFLSSRMFKIVFISIGLETNNIMKKKKKYTYKTQLVFLHIGTETNRLEVF